MVQTPKNEECAPQGITRKGLKAGRGESSGRRPCRPWNTKNRGIWCNQYQVDDSRDGLIAIVSLVGSANQIPEKSHAELVRFGGGDYGIISIGVLIILIPPLS